MTEEMDAVRALRARGVDNAEGLLDSATPEAILRTCEWWDGLSGVRPGLLVKRCREGGVPEAVTAVVGDPEGDRVAELIQRGGRVPDTQKKLRDRVYRGRFERYADAFPVGAVSETHTELAARLWSEDEHTCSGGMVVVELAYPHVTIECDECGFDACLTPATLQVGAPASLRLAA